MKKVWIIMSRDIKSFFTSPTFYIVGFMCAVVLSWVYPISFTMFAEMVKSFQHQPGMAPQQLNIHFGVFIRHLSYMNLILIFLVPALNMRLLSEEKKTRSYDLLLTSPVSSWQIIFAKYIAGLSAMLGVLLLSMIYPLTALMFTKISWGMFLSAYFGIFLVGAVYTSMNMFCSSLTESALVAYVMSVILNIAVWFVGIGVEVVDSSMGRAFFEHISLNVHLGGFLDGNIRLSALIFFTSGIFLFSFLSERVVESSRWR